MSRTRIKWWALVILVCSLALAAPRAAAHAPQAAGVATTCSLSWVGNEGAIEDFLRTADVQKVEDVPIGVTKPRRAVFAPDGPVARAAWKALAPSYRSGYRESYKAEIAGYLLDRLLDLHMVPPAVERRLDRSTGAMIYWIERTKPWDIKKPPAGPEPMWSRQVVRMKMFDQLIANIDRNAGNMLYDDDWHLFLIDHSRAFIEKKDLKGLAPPARIDRALWTKMDALTNEQLQSALGEWLSPKEIDAMLLRRDRMRAEIAKLVAARGEAGVFF
jgi:hypothetical protein